MEPPSTVDKKQPIQLRLLFFIIGGGMSWLLNTGIITACNKRQYSDWLSTGISVVTTAMIFFLWSYFVNFRTTTVWKECLPRYIVCQFVCNLLNYFILLSGMKEYGHGSLLLTLLMVAVVYSITGSVKFVLYNFWVFPGKRSAATT